MLNSGMSLAFKKISITVLRADFLFNSSKEILSSVLSYIFFLHISYKCIYLVYAYEQLQNVIVVLDTTLVVSKLLPKTGYILLLLILDNT